MAQDQTEQARNKPDSLDGRGYIKNENKKCHSFADCDINNTCDKKCQ